MATQISIEYADQFLPFWETADSVNVYAWATINGVLVAGSKDVPFGPATRGTNMLDDMKDTIVDVLQTLTGDVADTTYTPLDQFLNPATFGVGSLPYGNFQRMRPFVAVACQASYTWGLLNIPARTFVETIPFMWHFSFEAVTTDSSLSSPAYNAVMDYYNATGQSPTLLALELDPS